MLTLIIFKLLIRGGRRMLTPLKSDFYFTDFLCSVICFVPNPAVLPLSAGCKCGNSPLCLFHWILLLWVLWLKFLHFEGNRFVIWLHKNQGAGADENNFDLLRQWACWPFLLSLFLFPFSCHNVVCPGAKREKERAIILPKMMAVSGSGLIHLIFMGVLGETFALFTFCKSTMPNSVESRLSIKLLHSFHHPVCY